jgi:hypothetical protein
METLLKAVITIEQQGSEIEMLEDYRKLYTNAMC